MGMRDREGSNSSVVGASGRRKYWQSSSCSISLAYIAQSVGLIAADGKDCS